MLAWADASGRSDIGLEWPWLVGVCVAVGALLAGLALVALFRRRRRRVD